MIRATADYASSVEVCRVSGLTYRQLDYWARSGGFPTGACENPLGGSGRPRRWRREYLPAICAAASVANAFAYEGGGGSMEVRWFRRIIEAHMAGLDHIVIIPGVRIAWDTPHAPAAAAENAGDGGHVPGPAIVGPGTIHLIGAS